MSLDEKGEGEIEIMKCLGFLGFAFLVQVLLSNMITVPSVDNETAAAHLQGMFGSFVLHILMSLWLGLCVIFASQTVTYYLPAFVRSHVENFCHLFTIITSLRENISDTDTHSRGSEKSK